MKILRYKSNPNGDPDVDLIDEEEKHLVKEPYTLIPPPEQNWKPIFDFKQGKWIETVDKDVIKLHKWGVSTLEEFKELRKNKLSKECTNSILSGFTASVGKKEYTFSYDKEAQANLAERWQLFQNEMIDSIVLTARTLEDNTYTRLKVNKAEFTLVYLSSVKHKEDNISRLHDLLVPLVNSAVSIKQIEDIHWTNVMIHPNEPSIIVKDDKTLDKNIEKVEAKAEMVSQANQLNGLAMIEVANFVFANGFNKVP